MNKQYLELSKKFIEILSFLRANTIFNINPRLQYFINTFVKEFLYYFTKQDYILNVGESRAFIQLNPVISNIVAISGFGNTDAFIDILANESNNFVKILALYSSEIKLKLIMTFI